MNLKEGKAGQTYKVVGINIEQDIERRLEVLGLTEQSHILVVKNDKKGSMTVRFRGTRFAFGRRIAENIIVEDIDNE